MPFDWYKELSGTHPIEQGDLFQSFPVVIPPTNLVENEIHEVKVKLYNVIVLTQSCDLVQGKAEMVMVCPYYTLTELLANDPSYQRHREGGSQEKLLSYLNNEAKNFAAGRKIGYHLLDKNVACGIPEHLVVNLRKAFSLEVNYVMEFAATQNKRIRLLPPYREQLSQSFAILFMRVGLPSPIQPVD